MSELDTGALAPQDDSGFDEQAAVDPNPFERPAPEPEGPGSSNGAEQSGGAQALSPEQPAGDASWGSQLQQVQADLARERQQNAVALQRIQWAMHEAQQREHQRQQQVAEAEAQLTAPNFEQDPMGAMSHGLDQLRQEIQEVRETFGGVQQSMAAQQQQRSFEVAYSNDFAMGRQTLPGFDLAVGHVRDAHASHLQNLFGYTADQAQAVATRDINLLAAQGLESGQGGWGRIYRSAQSMGWQLPQQGQTPQAQAPAPSQQQAPGFAAPAHQAPTQPASPAAHYAQRRADQQTAPGRLPAGVPAASRLTPKQVVEMSPEELLVALERPGAVDDVLSQL